ncbi:MAG: hypothetical protein CMN31_21730 [Sandaracinus sp.]|nr:hypothetical protein [Sandaracinus sp.]
MRQMTPYMPATRKRAVRAGARTVRSRRRAQSAGRAPKAKAKVGVRLKAPRRGSTRRRQAASAWKASAPKKPLSWPARKAAFSTKRCPGVSGLP